ncbi:MAG: hypothetical protein AAGE52_27915 [Myxococcota bacterium]
MVVDLVYAALRSPEVHETVRRLRALSDAWGSGARVGSLRNEIRVERFGVTLWLQRSDGEWRLEGMSAAQSVVVLGVLFRP